MTSTKFPPTLAPVFALLVLLVLYFTIRKMEYEEPKVLQMLSKKEDGGLHSMGLTPDPFQSLTNSKL